MNSLEFPHAATDAALFGHVLRRQRVLAAVSIADLARRASVDAGRLREIERGLSEPDLVEIFRIADALNLQPSELVKQFEELSPYALGIAPG